MEIWTFCKAGHMHWGQSGGAGFLFRHVPQEGEPTYLLQLRANSVDHAGTWGIPGGAIRERESPAETAKREVVEEIGELPSYTATGVKVQDCGGGWAFHIFLADVPTPFLALCGQETNATGWFTKSEMGDLSLHPGLRTWLNEQPPIEGKLTGSPDARE